MAERKSSPEFGLAPSSAGNSLINIVVVDGKIEWLGGATSGKEGRNIAHSCVRFGGFEEEAIRAHLSRFGIHGSDPALRYGAEGNAPPMHGQGPERNRAEMKAPPRRDQRPTSATKADARLRVRPLGLSTGRRRARLIAKVEVKFESEVAYGVGNTHGVNSCSISFKLPFCSRTARQGSGFPGCYGRTVWPVCNPFHTHTKSEESETNNVRAYLLPVLIFSIAACSSESLKRSG